METSYIDICHKLHCNERINVSQRNGRKRALRLLYGQNISLKYIRCTCFIWWQIEHQLMYPKIIQWNCAIDKVPSHLTWGVLFATAHISATHILNKKNSAQFATHEKHLTLIYVMHCSERINVSHFVGESFLYSSVNNITFCPGNAESPLRCQAITGRKHIETLRFNDAIRRHQGAKN